MSLSRDEQPTYDELERALIIRDQTIAALRAELDKLTNEAFESEMQDNKAMAELAQVTEERDEALLRLNEALGCLGYPVPADTPTGNVKCGLCEAREDQIHQAQAENARLKAVLSKGKLWSFFRLVLSQGGDIQLDYNAGKYKCYEEYSARLDAAARERVEQFEAQAALASREGT